MSVKFFPVQGFMNQVMVKLPSSLSEIEFFSSEPGNKHCLETSDILSVIVNWSSSI